MVSNVTTTSTLESSTGMCSALPTRNSTLLRACSLEAYATASGLTSTPTTLAADSARSWLPYPEPDAMSSTRLPRTASVAAMYRLTWSMYIRDGRWNSGTMRSPSLSIVVASVMPATCLECSLPLGQGSSAGPPHSRLPARRPDPCSVHAARVLPGIRPGQPRPSLLEQVDLGGQDLRVPGRRLVVVQACGRG